MRCKGFQKLALSFYRLCGKGYVNGWWRNCKCRYRVYKGGRSTKKSYDLIGYEVLDKIISDPRRNVLIIRNTLNSHRLSTFSTLVMLINQPDMNNPDLSLARYFKISNMDMTITYKPTGQMIIFKGMDDPQKIQGIRVPKGFLTDVYVEEAYEIQSYEQWRKVDGSIRGKLPEGLFYQITFCMNAWDIGHWIYEKFFKDRFEDDYEYLLNHKFADYRDDNYIGDYGIGLYLHTSTYKINEFRDTEVYDVAMEHLRQIAPEIYKVEGLGMWGNTSEGTYMYWNDSLVIPTNTVMSMRYAITTIGIDIGMGNGEGKMVKNDDLHPNRVGSAMTMQLFGLTDDFSKMISMNEYFHTNENKEFKKSSVQIAEEMILTIGKWMDLYAGNPTILKGTILIYVESADPGGFRNLLEDKAKQFGYMNLKFITATKNKIQSRVDFSNLMMAYGEYLVCDQCSNLRREIKNARRGKDGRCRADIDDHAINANEYAWIPLLSRIRRYKDFKEH